MCNKNANSLIKDIYKKTIIYNELFYNPFS